MCLSLSATVILSCLFMPKLRVVLLKPDKNVRSKSKIVMKNSTISAYNKNGKNCSTTTATALVEKSFNLTTIISTNSSITPPTFHKLLNTNNMINNDIQNTPTSNSENKGFGFLKYKFNDQF
jgi:hypothetical protein